MVTSGSQEPNSVFPLGAMVQDSRCIHGDCLEHNYEEQGELTVFTYSLTQLVMCKALY